MTYADVPRNLSLEIHFSLTAGFLKDARNTPLPDRSFRSA